MFYKTGKTCFVTSSLVAQKAVTTGGGRSLVPGLVVCLPTQLIMTEHQLQLNRLTGRHAVVITDHAMTATNV